jgi:hypothetical protein
MKQNINLNNWNKIDVGNNFSRTQNDIIHFSIGIISNQLRRNYINLHKILNIVFIIYQCIDYYYTKDIIIRDISIFFFGILFDEQFIQNNKII